MRTIPQRELRNDSGRVLADVAAGETIEVTSNGTVMAVMVPPRLSPVERGLRDGTVRPARHRGRVSDLPRVAASESIQHALDEMRADT
jgi:prevent-host-death family protein